MSRFPAALLLLFAAGAAQPQSHAPSIRVDVRLVNVFANVTDAAGAPVGGLSQDNFVLTEDGRPQKIAVFERQTAVPLAVALAIDTSGTVRKDISIEQRAAHGFVHTLLRPQDRLSLFDFNSDVRQAVAFTGRLRPIDEGIEHLRFGPATALYSAVAQASAALEGESGRRVLVIISDGGNTVKGTGYAEALEAAVRAETMVYSIIDVPVAADAGRDTGGEHALITLSQQTGGRYYYADAAHLEEAFQKVSDDLRTQYLLGYYPAQQVTDGNFRTIEVTLKGVPGGEGYTVRHRAGYYAEAGQQ